MPRKVTRKDEWTDDELILAVASCPREKQSYSPRHRNVIELADLIGRSRGAVSHRFANISFLIHGPPHGEPHVSERTREIWDQFKGRDEELQATAAEIRRRLMTVDPTPRVEAEVPKDSTKQLTLDVFAAAAKAGLPKDSVQVYERAGSWHFGVVLSIVKEVIENAERASGFLTWIGDRLAGQFTRSKGYDLAIQGDWAEIAAQILSREAPKFHVKDLDASGRISLALRLNRDPTPVSWRTREWPERLPPHMNRGAEAQRVGEYFGLDPRNLCDRCLLMLKALVDHLVADSTND
jgi:hypothetical protein